MKIETIEKAIDVAIKEVKKFKGSRDELITIIIEPLQVTLKAGIKAGLYCTEKSIKAKFRRLQKALQQFDERPSERAMRLSKQV